MTLVPFTECCLQLGIDPKTLRLWLKTAQLSWCLHPTDARLKCLTHDQLQQVAALHDRRLPTTPPTVWPSAAPEPLALPASVQVSEQRASLRSPTPQPPDLPHHLNLLQPP